MISLLSWFDEQPEHLYRHARSLEGFASHLLAVDGRYAHYPSDVNISPREQFNALKQGALEAGVLLHITARGYEWAGGEVEKRAYLFARGLELAEPNADWFLIMDADCHIDSYASGWQGALTTTTADTANLTVQNIRPDEKIIDTVTHRALFRAIPGLTVTETHWCYTAPGSNGTRFLWMAPNARVSNEPCADLGGVVMHHRRLDRDADRLWAARGYYAARTELGLERAPSWT